MRPGIFYLPEYHEFQHIATVPWPNIAKDYQQDWVEAIDILENWLTSRVGAHYSHWAYAQQANQEYWHACVAFREARYKTLFLLTWA